MLAIARALIVRPRFMLFDEPSAGLSPKLAAEALARVAALAERGVGVLLVEQNIREAMRIANRIYVLVGGRNRFQGRPADITDRRQLMDIYLRGANDEETFKGGSNKMSEEAHHPPKGSRERGCHSRRHHAWVRPVRRAGQRRVERQEGIPGRGGARAVRGRCVGWPTGPARLPILGRYRQQAGRHLDRRPYLSGPHDDAGRAQRAGRGRGRGNSPDHAGTRRCDVRVLHQRRAARDELDLRQIPGAMHRGLGRSRRKTGARTRSSPSGSSHRSI